MKNRLIALVLCGLMLAAFLPVSNSFIITANAASPLKQRSTFFTDEDVENMRANAVKYSWVASQRDGNIQNADIYLEGFGLEGIWSLATSQDMPRCYAVESPLDCINCHDKQTGYSNNLLTKPWKVTCSKCGMTFPTNDFESYYKSSLDENGIFIPGKGDKKYLVNTLYPEKGEKWGVDDGWGVAEGSQRYMYAAYLATRYWDYARYMVAYFYNSYLYTGEQKYADAGIVLLDRVADLYPALDITPYTRAKGFFFSDGGGYQGKIGGSISECEYVLPFLYAYDAFFPAFKNMSKEALDLLKIKSGGKKATYQDVMVNIENGLVKQIYPAVQTGKIRGNSGMHQRALALAAVVLDDKTLSKQWLDFVFRSGSTTVKKITGGNLSTIFVNDIDRDGFGNESAPDYNSGWLSFYFDIAKILDGYVINGTDISYDLYQNVKFKKMFYSMINLIVSDIYTPNIGDTQYTGNPKLFVNLNQTLNAYLKFGDPLFAQAAYLVNGNSAENLRIEPTEKEPEMTKAVEEVIKEHGILDITSTNLTGFGFAALQNGVLEEATVSEPIKNLGLEAADIEILNEKSVEDPGAVRVEDGIRLSPATMATLTFPMGGSGAVYDVVIHVLRDGAKGAYNVYIDGKLAQEALELSGKEALGEKAYMRKTFALTKGLHYITFEPVEDTVGATITGITLVKSADIIKEEKISTKTSLTMYYGRNDGHGHNDNLNLGLYAFNLNLTPDLGTPEVKDSTDMMRQYFIENVISHNTVMVDKGQQSEVIASEPTHFDDSEFVKLISVDAANAYIKTDEYERTSALIKYSDDVSYFVDFFKVAGGKNHIYSFHSAESSKHTTTGLELTKQTDSSGNYVGTLLSPGISWGGKNDVTGFQYFTKIRRDEAPKGDFTIDWDLVDTWQTGAVAQANLKLHMLGKYDKVTLAVGTPPRNKAGNPSELEYVLVENESSDTLTSLFSAVIEPYAMAESFIVSSELVNVAAADGKAEKDSTEIKAIKVVLKNGRTDYIICNTGDTSVEYTIDGQYKFKGFFGVISVVDGKVSLYSNDSEIICDKKTNNRLTGKVSSFTKELTDKNYINVTLDKDTDPASLAGKYIYIDNNHARNASYKIVSAEKSGKEYKLYIGDVTLIERYLNANDTSKGYVYDVTENAAFYIPLSYEEGFKVEEATVDLFSGAVLSHGAKKNVKAGEFVSNIMLTDKNAVKASEATSYTITVDESFGDGALFEVKDGALYAKSDISTTSNITYSLNLKVTTDKGNCNVLASLSTMSASAEKTARYVDLPLTYIAPEGENDDPAISDDPVSNENGGIFIWIIIGIAVVAAAGGAVFVLSKKKTNK